VFTGLEEPDEAPGTGRKKSRPQEAGGLASGKISRLSDYGAYVIVRTPATLAIVMVVPCEKPVGYVSFATEFRAFT
jgi:hypothetical protein